MALNRMKTRINSIKKDENGAIFIEAAIVLPIVFFVVFLIIYAGIVYYQSARVDDIVNRKAIKGAQAVKDPLMYDILNNGTIPTENNDVQPYRYIVGNYKELENAIKDEVIKEITNDGLVIIKSMQPEVIDNGKIASFNNKVFYSTFSVDVVYEIKFPIVFFNDYQPRVVTLSSRAEIPVNDTPEFIRNVDMVTDLLYGTKVMDNIQKYIDKINNFLLKFTN